MKIDALCEVSKIRFGDLKHGYPFWYGPELGLYIKTLDPLDGNPKWNAVALENGELCSLSPGDEVCLAHVIICDYIKAGCR